jgi:hypothetical protein
MRKQITITLDTAVIPHLIGIIDKHRKDYEDLFKDGKFVSEYPYLAKIAKQAIADLSGIRDTLNNEI